MVSLMRSALASIQGDASVITETERRRARRRARECGERREVVCSCHFSPDAADDDVVRLPRTRDVSE